MKLTCKRAGQVAAFEAVGGLVCPYATVEPIRHAVTVHSDPKNDKQKNTSGLLGRFMATR